MKQGTKYHPLYEHLQRSDKDEVVLTLGEIEALLDAKLPASARRQPGWWSNRSRGAVQAAAWMGAGYHVTAVDLDKARITFTRPYFSYTARRVGDTVLWTGDLIKGLRYFLGFTQEELAQKLGVRQQTISEWETNVYAPSRSTSKYLSLVAEKAGFTYEVHEEEDSS